MRLNKALTISFLICLAFIKIQADNWRVFGINQNYMKTSGSNPPFAKFHKETITYDIDPFMADDYKNAVREAFQEWNNVGCVSFVEDWYEPDIYVRMETPWTNVEEDNPQITSHDIAINPNNGEIGYVEILIIPNADSVVYDNTKRGVFYSTSEEMTYTGQSTHWKMDIQSWMTHEICFKFFIG